MSRSNAVKTILLTGGRAFSTLDLARMFARDGHRVIVADALGRYVCQASNAVAASYRVAPPRSDFAGFIHDIRHIVLSEHVDVVVPTCEEALYLAKGRAAFEGITSLFVADLASMLTLHDKGRFSQFLQGLGIATPRTDVTSSRTELENVVRARGGATRLVLKPAFSRFAANVAFVDAGAEPPLSVVPSQLEPWLVQDFIPGRELCTYSVARSGRILAHVAYEHAFTVGGSGSASVGAGISFESVEDDRLLHISETIAHALGYTGQLALDAISTPSGELYVIECNPRATSGVHLLAKAPRLAATFLGTGAERETLRLAAPPRMLGFAMLLYGARRALRSRADFRLWLRTLLRSQDVLAAKGDAKPAFYQIVCLASMAWTAIRRRTSFLSVATSGLEWNGDTGENAPTGGSWCRPSGQASLSPHVGNMTVKTC